MEMASERAQNVFPAGSNGEFNLPSDLGMVIQRGRGCELWDTSDNHFYDFSMGWGSALVGHAHPRIVEAVAHQATQGSNFAYVTQPALELAETLREISPACDQVRFCASGTEATMYCLRLARAVTKRPRVLKFEGAYHGANDTGVTSLFPTESLPYPKPHPTSAGIDPDLDRHVLVAPFNDLETTCAIIDDYGRDLAAVIVEPLQRCVPPRSGFLEGLRDITREREILLVFDEVVTGFRLAYGGAQKYYGVTPDLVAYGKALGGGYPIGVYGGSREVMDWVREERMGGEEYVWTASTLGGNPVSAAASLAALAVYREPGCYRRLHELGTYLRTRMAQVLGECEVIGQIIGDGPLAQVVFSGQPVHDYRSTQRGNKQLGRSVMLEMFRQGIFLNPMGTKLYLSLAHTEHTCDIFIERFERALRKCAGHRLPADVRGDG